MFCKRDCSGDQSGGPLGGIDCVQWVQFYRMGLVLIDTGMSVSGSETGKLPRIAGVLLAKEPKCRP